MRIIDVAKVVRVVVSLMTIYSGLVSADDDYEFIYQLGGASAIGSAASNRDQTVRIGGGVGWNTDLMCGNFDINLSIQNQLNGVSGAFQNLMDNVINAANSSPLPNQSTRVPITPSLCFYSTTFSDFPTSLLTFLPTLRLLVASIAFFTSPKRGHHLLGISPQPLPSLKILGRASRSQHLPERDLSPMLLRRLHLPPLPLCLQLRHQFRFTLQGTAPYLASSD